MSAVTLDRFLRELAYDRPATFGIAARALCRDWPRRERSDSADGILALSLMMGLLGARRVRAA